jgi:hypothetical protein
MKQLLQTVHLQRGNIKEAGGGRSLNLIKLHYEFSQNSSALLLCKNSGNPHAKDLICMFIRYLNVCRPVKLKP